MRALVSRFTPDGGHRLDLAEVPVPEPGPGQVRVKVAASAVNPVDLATAQGLLAAGGLHPPRKVIGLGWDVAGTIDALGPEQPDPPTDTASYAVGDAVIGLADVLDVDTAAHADYIVLDRHQIAHAPRGLDPVAAETLPLNTLTAHQALERLALTPGQTVLVTGAAGGVGGFAVELAALRGLHVVATTGAADEEPVRGFGARWFVPRDVPRLAAAVRAHVPGGVDAAVDAVPLGPAAVLGAIRNRGAYVSVAGGQFTPLRSITTDSIWITADPAHLAHVAHMASRDTAALTPRIAATYPLTEAPKAYQHLATGTLRGRIVLTM
jgi:NADPH:quinone reductase-like Zn-dependent oxidoreductase